MRKLSLLIVAIVAALCVGCATTGNSVLYQVVVVDQSGSPLKDAYVTPNTHGKNFEQVTTGSDGIAQLKENYEEEPRRINVQKAGYYETDVPWALPSLNPLEIMLKKF